MNIAQTINRCGYQRMSDDQSRDELAARRQLEAATRAMVQAIQNVNYASSVVTINPDAFADFIHDWLPTERDWDEKIAEARHG